jgi:FixJ family two-component response regulator
MNPKNLNLYIVEDDDALRRSLVSLLTSHLEDLAVRSFSSGEAFLDSIDTNQGGVVVLDKDMSPAMNGLEVFERLRALQSPLIVVFLSGRGSIPDVVQAMEGGAVTWLTKPCSNDELIEVVKRAGDRAMKLALHRQGRQKAVLLWATLSPREKQLVWPIASGFTSKKLSKSLALAGDHIHWRTVDTHRAHIFEKLVIKKSNELQAFIREYALEDEAIAAFSKRDKIR